MPPSGFPSYRGHIVTGAIKAAVEHARTVADGKNVELVGEVSAPSKLWPLGRSTRSGSISAEAGQLHSTETIPGEEVIHPRYQVR